MERVYNELHNLAQIKEKYDHIVQCEAFYMDATPYILDETNINYKFYMIFEFFKYGTL